MKLLKNKTERKQKMIKEETRPLDLSEIQIVVNGKRDYEVELYIQLFWSEIKQSIESIKNDYTITSPEQSIKNKTFKQQINLL